MLCLVHADQLTPRGVDLPMGCFLCHVLPGDLVRHMVLRSMLPSDGPPNTLISLTGLAVILALMVQPGVLGWLFAASRMTRSWL
jgi:hypothetical protein